MEKEDFVSKIVTFLFNQIDVIIQKGFGIILANLQDNIHFHHQNPIEGEPRNENSRDYLQRLTNRSWDMYA